MTLFLNLLDTEQDKSNFKKLYDNYKNLLYWIALKKTKSNEDAEECVQETFLYVAKNFDKIDDVDSKRTKCYLSTIVTGFAIDIHNKAQKEKNLNTFCELSDNSDDFNGYDKLELMSVLDRTLNEEDKIFFYLKYIYGFTSREIAQLYNVKDTYVRKRLQYSKEKLKKALQ